MNLRLKVQLCQANALKAISITCTEILDMKHKGDFESIRRLAVLDSDPEDASNVDHCGLCEMFFNRAKSLEFDARARNHGMNIMTYHASKWEHFSGNNCYPIGLEGHCPNDLYVQNSENFTTMWCEGEYAEMRWKYVEYILECVTKEIEELETNQPE